MEIVELLSVQKLNAAIKRVQHVLILIGRIHGVRSLRLMLVVNGLIAIHVHLQQFVFIHFEIIFIDARSQQAFPRTA